MQAIQNLATVLLALKYKPEKEPATDEEIKQGYARLKELKYFITENGLDKGEVSKFKELVEGFVTGNNERRD